ncbi:MAG: hypothetical protein P8O04_04420 [Flavobacteriaceae bacterium]|mgnify:FL=1|jgi:hypothetical protein|nr:hypothetical protein [Flavobacteriaceae bacterium]
MNSYNEISRAEFMQFFRDDEKLNELTPDDRVEVFRTILLGSSDLTKELLEAIITDYSVSNLQVIKVEHA